MGCEPQRAVDALLEHALNHGGVGIVVGEVFAGEGSRHEVDDCVDIGGHLGEGTGDWDDNLATSSEGLELGYKRAFCSWERAQVSVKAPSTGQVGLRSLSRASGDHRAGRTVGGWVLGVAGLRLHVDERLAATEDRSAVAVECQAAAGVDHDVRDDLLKHFEALLARWLLAVEAVRNVGKEAFARPGPAELSALVPERAPLQPVGEDVNKRVVIQPKAVTLRFRQFFEIVAIGVDPLGRPRGIRIDIEIGKVAEQAERRAEDILNRSDELAAGEWGELAGRA